MTLAVDTGYIDIYEPFASEPHLRLTPPDLRMVNISKEVQDAAGTASISINNVGGKYAGEINSGDRLEFKAQLALTESSTITRYGSGTYGGGSYGMLDGETHLWTGMAGIPRYAFDGHGQRTITLEAQPFAFGVMGSLGRKVDNAFRDTTVTEIATTIINDEAAVLDTSGIEQFDTVYNVEYDGRSLLDAVAELADVVDAVLTAQGTTVIMKPLGNIPIQWTTDGDDFEGGWNVDPVDDEVYNQVRVEGGVDNDIGDKQTAQTGYKTVTQNDPVMVQMALEKSRTNQVDVWTNPTGSQEDYTVRIQEDIGGQPTDVTDQSKDLVSKTLSSEFIEQDGFTTFLLEQTQLPAPNPWLIVESGGENGQQVGVNTDGVLTYRGYYYYPIITQQSNQASIQEYRRREHRVERQSISTAQAASELASTILKRSANPRKEISTEAATERAHSLKPADAIQINIPEDDAVGVFMVTNKDSEYSPDGSRNLLKTTLRLVQVETF